MHRILITLLTAALVGGTAFAQTFPDIPANHWAGDAVEEIADLGIVIGFPDGTFRGNEAFTRYQAALVVSRLLAVVDANMDAELSGLRAAMQDLASDVAAQGVRLAAAESAIAGISDDVAANSGRIGALEDALAGLEAAMADSAVLRDLQNQIASQRVAIDTAQAQAEAAAARADAAYDLALQGLAESDANASDIAALNRALQILSDRVDGMGAPVAPVMPDPFDPSGLQAGIDRNAGDIANIREFVILLRRDQVALRDRVAALEAADAATAEAIADLDARVATLERTALQISGSISLTYNVNRFAGCVTGCGFDVDRVYGLGFRRDMGASFVSTGTNPTDGFAAAERPAQRRPEFTQSNGFTSTLSISVIGNQAFDGTSQPRGLNAFSAVADLDFRQAYNLDSDAAGTPADRFSGYVLRVRSFTTTFDPIGAEPLTFRFGRNINTRTISSAYTFDVRNERGYLATLGAPDFLAFLSPTLWVAYTDPANDGTENRTAIRGTMAPSLGDAVELSGGFTFARSAVNTGDKDDVLADNDETTVWGLDGNAMLLGIVGLEFEYASNLADANSILFVKASVDGSALPILESLNANYRAIALDWDGISSPGNDDPTTAAGYPFVADQTGFGVEGTLGLFILEVSAFFDSYAIDAGDTVSAFGVYGSADLFAGFSLGAFFESVSVNSAVADTNDTAALRRQSRGYINMDGVYTTQFGVSLSHDGDAANALISGLDLDIEYRRFNADFGGSDLDVLAQYDLDIAFVALRPYVGYRMYDDNRAPRSQYNELVAGTSLQTTSFDFGVVSPSLVAAVNYRNTNYGADNTAGTFVATELQWSVGVVLDEFLFGEYSTLSARYGSYSATNVASFAAAPVANPVPRVGRDADADLAGASTSTTGYEVQWNYYDLVFAYANYATTDGVDARSAQQFRVTYTVNF